MEEENSSRNKNLFGAVEKEDKELVQALLQNQKFLDVNCQFEEKDGATALHKAAEKGFEKIVKILLEHGANPDLQDKGGCVALRFAAEKGFKEIVKILLEHGANTNLQDQYGWSALFKAAEKNFEEIVQLLLEYGAKIDIQDQCGWTTLHKAAEKGFEELVKFLLERGANPNLQEQNRDTPLHFAAEKGFKEIVKVLLEHGATIDLLCNKKFTSCEFRDVKKKIMDPTQDKNLCRAIRENEVGPTTHLWMTAYPDTSGPKPYRYRALNAEDFRSAYRRRLDIVYPHLGALCKLGTVKCGFCEKELKI